MPIFSELFMIVINELRSSLHTKRRSCMASRRESMLMIRITRLPEYTPVTGGDDAGAVELLDDDRAEDA